MENKINLKELWFYNSFAPCFIKPYSKDSLYHKEILKTINNSEFPVFSEFVKGTKIYLEAKESDKSTKAIAKLNKSLNLSTESLSERYRILLYNLSPNKTNEYLLDEVITNSKEIIASTNNDKTRAKYRYFTAHSYYLKAENSSTKKDRKKYLELANSYSPNASDKKFSAEAYFYEKYLLDGYEDYGKFLNEFLFAEGDSSQVLKNLFHKALFNFVLIDELKSLHKN